MHSIPYNDSVNQIGTSKDNGLQGSKPISDDDLKLLEAQLYQEKTKSQFGNGGQIE